MAIKLYYYSMASPSVRAVILTLKVLGIPYELKHLNMLEGEHLSEEFLKLNPQHTIPTIQDDDGFVIWESHAINAYLVNRYGKNDKLYPKEPKARAVIDQRLHFDNGVLFISLRNVMKAAFYQKTLTKMTDEYTAPIEEGYDFLEKFLAGNQYAAGNDITIADFSILTTLGNASVLVPINKNKFPLITEYTKRCQSDIPGFKELHEEGLKSCREFLKNLNFELPPQ